MCKLICVKDTKEYYSGSSNITKGQIVFLLKSYGGKIIITNLNNEEYYGLFEEKDFMNLDKWRE